MELCGTGFRIDTTMVWYLSASIQYLLGLALLTKIRVFLVSDKLFLTWRDRVISNVPIHVMFLPELEKLWSSSTLSVVTGGREPVETRRAISQLLMYRYVGRPLHGCSHSCLSFLPSFHSPSLPLSFPSCASSL